MNLKLLRLLIHFCMFYHVDPFLAESVIRVESNWDNSRIGAVGEIGLFQLNPESFNLGKEYLSNPINNLKTGVEYLALMKKTCSFQENISYIICYNRGIAGSLRVKDYKTDKYYMRVMTEYNKLIQGESR